MWLVPAVWGSKRRRAWVRIALRNGMQWEAPSSGIRTARPPAPWPASPPEHKAAETVDASCGAGTEEGAGRFDGLRRTSASIHAGFFGVGGLIHVAVGLAGGTGGFLTKRSGFSWNT